MKAVKILLSTLTIMVYTIPEAVACVNISGIENVMMKSEASAEEMLVSSMNRLGYGVHANSFLNTKQIRAVEESTNKKAAVNQIASELRRSFEKLGDPNFFPYRDLAAKFAKYPEFSPYNVPFAELTDERNRAMAYFASLDPNVLNTTPGNAWVANSRSILKYRKIVDAINEKEFNANAVILSFWMNHFNVDAMKSRQTVPHYELALKRNICKTFYDMLLTSAKQPAMLFYLDNVVNVKNNLNENYAREVIELHTLGVGPTTTKEDGTTVVNYTSNEILNAAKVLSGWNFNGKTHAFQFNSALNEDGDKKFTELFDNVKISKSEGVQGGERFLRLLAQHPRTKRNICRKIGISLYGKHPGIEEVDKCVAAYGNLGNLPKMYQSYIMSPKFWDKSQFFKGVKNPFENLISATRGMGIQIANNEDSSNIVKVINAESENLGEPVYTFAEPTGLKRLNNTTMSSVVISNRIDVLNRLTDYSKVVHQNKSNLPLEKEVSRYIASHKKEESYLHILKNIVPVFPPFMYDNNYLKNLQSNQLTDPDTLNGEKIPLKTTLVRILTSGGFLRK